MTKIVEKAAAVITVRDAELMTLRGRWAVARWMVHEALFLIRHGPEYSKRYTARFICPREE